jgi:serine/threonine protein kinase
MVNRNRTLLRLGLKAAKSRAYRNSDALFDDFVDTLTDLGGIYAKFLQGVLLSVVSEKKKSNTSRHLSVFEDNPAPQFNPHDVLASLLGERAREVVVTDTQPIGVGSYSAVYRGVIVATQEPVAIKILRPGIKKELGKDLKFLKKLSYIMAHGSPGRIPIELAPLYKNFSKACRREMDFAREVALATELRERYRGHGTIYIPKMYQNYSGDHLIVQEFIEGTSGTDLLSAKADGENPEDIARLAANTDLQYVMTELLHEAQMALMNGQSFHGDLHPGNIRLMGNNRVALIDFGIRAEPFSPHIVEPYVNKVLSDIKIFEGDLDLVRIIDAHFRFLMQSLFKSIYSVHKMAQKDMRDFYEKLLAGLNVDIGKVGESTKKEWIQRGSPVRILTELVPNFKDYGLTGKISEQSPQRALHTLNTLNIAIGRDFHRRVFCVASRRSAERIKLLNPDVFKEPTVLLPDLALETIYAWLEKVTHSNPRLARTIRRSLLSEQPDEKHA